MTDELGTGHRDVPGNLFDLDENHDPSARPAGTANVRRRAR